MGKELNPETKKQRRYNKWINIGDGVYVNLETIYKLSDIEPEEELIQIIGKEILRLIRITNHVY